ncbi:MAG TPA: peptidyl-prolyl cis-trans isomerase [Pirellulales bacterium]|nr:peptidyl-prolyl cis-trans isomerase [Pirellulales bacterium]
MSRLFYPTLFGVTAALGFTLWTRHGLPTDWLSTLDAAVAQAQTPASGGGPPPSNGSANVTQTGPERLPPTASPAGPQPPDDPPNRPRQGPLSQLQIDTPGGPRSMEITRPVRLSGARVLARIGNEVILAAELLPQVNGAMEQFDKMYGDQVTPERREQQFQVLLHHELIRALHGKLIVAAMKEEIPHDKIGEVEKDILKQFDKYQLPDVKKQFKVKTDAELDTKLREQGRSLKQMKRAFIDSMLINEWLRKEVKFDEHVSHQQMFDYYNEHIKEYEFKAKVRFEEIRVNYGRQRDKATAWQMINRLGHQVYNGAPLPEVAKAHSDAVSSAKGGLNDWTSEGSIRCAELDKALFHLPIGVLSKVIDDNRGFVIVRVLERNDAGVTSFQDAQAGIKKKIKDKREQDAKEKRLTTFMQEQTVRAWTIYDDQPLEALVPTATKRR